MTGAFNRRGSRILESTRRRRWRRRGSGLIAFARASRRRQPYNHRLGGHGMKQAHPDLRGLLGAAVGLAPDRWPVVLTETGKDWSVVRAALRERVGTSRSRRVEPRVSRAQGYQVRHGLRLARRVFPVQTPVRIQRFSKAGREVFTGQYQAEDMNGNSLWIITTKDLKWP